MGQTTKIQWTEATWNPVRGCSRVSPGCVNCYAETLAARLSAYGTKPDSPFRGFVTKVNGHASWTGKVELVEKHLYDPLKWRTPRMIFVNSMSDMFHEELSDEVIDQIFAVMALCPQHTFQVLTKRPDRMLRWFSDLKPFPKEVFMDTKVSDFISPHCERIEGHVGRLIRPDISSCALAAWPLPNVWLGVSVEDRAHKDRIDLLRETPAAIRFLSIEPLLEDIGELDLRGVHWVIVGGESGPNARPFYLGWAESVVHQCKSNGVSCFIKQLGSNPMDGPDDPWSLRDKKGGDPSEWPVELRVREMPAIQNS